MTITLVLSGPEGWTRDDWRSLAARLITDVLPNEVEATIVTRAPNGAVLSLDAVPQ